MAKKVKNQSETEQKAGKHQPETKTEKRTIECALSDSEVVRKLDAIEGVSKIIAALKERLKLLRTEVRDRSELREIECEVEFDYKSHTVFVTRTDTREVIERRPVAKEEKNLELPF